MKSKMSSKHVLFLYEFFCYYFYKSWDLKRISYLALFWILMQKEKKFRLLLCFNIQKKMYGLLALMYRGVTWSMVSWDLFVIYNTWDKSICQHTLTTELTSKEYLLLVVPQVTVKLMHLELNKFSDTNRLFRSDVTFETSWYAEMSHHLGVHIFSRVICTLLSHRKQLKNSLSLLFLLLWLFYVFHFYHK